MTKINFTPSTFGTRIQELKEGIDNHKLVNSSLELQDPENGFIRFLKVLILPIARLFDADPFAHVRADKVALAIFAEFTKHEKELTLEQKSAVYFLLNTLNTKTKEKYTPIFKVAMPHLSKAITKSLPLPNSFPTQKEIGGEIKINDDTENTEGYTLPEPTDPLEIPPAPPFPDETAKGKAKPQTKEEPSKEPKIKTFNPFEIRDDLSDVFGKTPAIKTQDKAFVVKIFNSPIQKQAVSKLSHEINAFLEVLEYTSPDSDELDLDSDDDYLGNIEKHEILGRFYKEYPKIPKENRQEWLDKTSDYLENVFLADLNKIKAKNAKSTQEAVESMQQHNATVGLKQKMDEFEKLKTERQKLIKEISFDQAEIQGVVKKTKWKYKLSQNNLEPTAFDGLKKTILAWLESAQMPTISRIKANQTIDLDFANKIGDEELVKIAQFNLLTKIITDWKQENR